MFENEDTSFIATKSGDRYRNTKIGTGAAIALGLFGPTHLVTLCAPKLMGVYRQPSMST